MSLTSSTTTKRNLNLVLIESCIQSCMYKSVNFWGVLRHITSGSLPRLYFAARTGTTNVDDTGLVLRKLSDTSWVSHTRAVQVVLNSLLFVIYTLNKIAIGKITNAKCKTVSEANGLPACWLLLNWCFFYIILDKSFRL